MSYMKNYIEKIILSSPILRKNIRGIHLNVTFPFLYRKNKLKDNKEKLILTKDRIEQYKIIMDHITNLDSHKIYNDTSINKILKKLNIEYLVYEFKWENKNQLLENLENQNKVLLI